MSDYNFSFTTKKFETPDTDLRKGLHIAKCCGNCFYFWYEGGKERRGYCRANLPETKKYHADPAVLAACKKTWYKTHVTMLCDLHRFQSKYYTIDRIITWVQKKFDDFGNLNE